MYTVWYAWEMHNLEVFCSDVKSGTALTALPEMAEKHGISPRWLTHQGAFNKNDGLWSLYVPSSASVGANVCAIRHNKSEVVSATIQID